MGQLSKKVVVVTGASKGIGAGIANGVAAAGAAVVVNYATSREGAEQVVRQIRAQGGRALAVQGDMAKIADVRRLFAETKQTFGSLDVLVNNAGVFKFEPLGEVTEAEFHHQFNTNVLGTILATQEAVKYFGPDGGSVINVGSVAGSNPPELSLVYGATKSALESITRVLSRELGPRKIRVNLIAPGPTQTEGAHDSGVFESEWGRQMLADTPLGRFGRPEDIAPVVVFLASDDARWVTGERVRVAGGFR